MAKYLKDGEIKLIHQNPYTKANRSGSKEQLLNDLNRLNKIANQRLRNLEKATDYKDILNYSYRTALKDIEDIRGKEAKRFQEKIPEGKLTLSEIQSQINKVEKFLDAPTSTITGLKNVYIKRTVAYNKEFGTDFTWQELEAYINSATYQKLDAKFDYRLLSKTLNKIPKKMSELFNEIKETGRTKSKIRKMDILAALKNLDGLSPNEKEVLQEYVKGTKLQDLKNFY